MISYRDTTFCVNKQCKNRCHKFLTTEIMTAAKSYGLPIAVSEFICLDLGEDGAYKSNIEETDA